MPKDVFGDVRVLVGRIQSVATSPDKKSYHLEIDLGAAVGVKRSSAQIVDFYTKMALRDRLVLCSIHVSPMRVGSFISEVVVNGFQREDGAWILAVPDAAVPVGTRLW